MFRTALQVFHVEWNLVLKLSEPTSCLKFRKSENKDFRIFSNGWPAIFQEPVNIFSIWFQILLSKIRIWLSDTFSRFLVEAKVSWRRLLRFPIEINGGDRTSVHFRSPWQFRPKNTLWPCSLCQKHSTCQFSEGYVKIWQSYANFSFRTFEAPKWSSFESRNRCRQKISTPNVSHGV